MTTDCSCLNETAKKIIFLIGRDKCTISLSMVLQFPVVFFEIVIVSIFVPDKEPCSSFGGLLAMPASVPAAL